MAVKAFSAAMKKVFGTRNERMVKRYLRIVDQVSSYEDQMRALSDAELRAKTDEFRERIQTGESPRDMIPEVFAAAREAMDRAVGIRNIFNPEREFDPSVLDENARALYVQTKKLIDETEPREPEGDLLGGREPVPAWKFVDIPRELYDAVREAHPESRPPFRARPFDVQIIGAVVLYEGRIAEMKTGEGKTIVAPLSAYLAALEGKQVHVVTVNSYLVQRDRDWTFPFFRALGLTVGANHPVHANVPEEYRRLSMLKKQAYDCDIVYGTTSEFGFDYLRDNMKLSAEEQVQKRRDFAIVDEVDSVLIDEARTPLIISGPAHQHAPRYDLADRLARHLLEKQAEWNKADQRVQSCLVEISSLEGDIRNARDKEKVPAMKERLEAARAKLPELEAERDKHTQYYEVEMDKKKASLTHDGIAEAQRHAGLGSFYVGDNIDLPHLLEQSIRAHTVYQRDRDYVVAPDDGGELGVVIVDQNTGRKMVGRQWSDGLHQAVEAKEGVAIKQETQTMATITIQNFFKLYDRLSGMTGTADTEATEFYEIYSLDVVVIPTNLPIRRDDHDDLVFMSQEDKWNAIVDEIKHFHDIGRPVLVGTTSVEKSDELSKRLSRKHNIQHEVLNAKQHEREGQIITRAGELGAVMIATNMAGRGTDIVLGKFTREQLVDHWKRRGLAPKDVATDQDDEAIRAAVYRHIAPKELGLKKNEVAEMSDEEIEISLLRHWALETTNLGEGKIESMSAEALRSALDATGASMLHAIRMFRNIEDMGGLHVIGTERHDSRRIDNQLRGRSGRQGDKGSSRFFLSLDDDLMKMFAGKTTLNVLSKLGMKEGDAIEHPMLSKAVGRAQRKVEERNFLIRKNILEYDEVMDHQRHQFYGMRQEILEGRNIRELIFSHIDESVQDAVSRYLDRNYVPNCIAEWVRENLNVSIDAERIRGKDREDLHKLLNIDAKEDAGGMIRMTMAEYLPEELEESEWDYSSLASWANANFQADVKESQLREMSRSEVEAFIEAAAERMIDAADLSPLDQYLVPHYGEKELARWAASKFNTEVDPERFVGVEKQEDAVDLLMNEARKQYREREIRYPVDFAIDFTGAQIGQNPQNATQALQQFCQWVRSRYELEWTPDSLPSRRPVELHEYLIKEARTWDDDRIAQRVDRAFEEAKDAEGVRQWCESTLGARFTDEDREQAEADPRGVLEQKIRETLRLELTQFERWVLLQIIDQAWKDHLYAIDQLRESIGLRSFSQRDPRIEFKREGGRLFDEMHESIRDKVTDLIFKGKLMPQTRQTASPQEAAGQASQRPTAASTETASAGPDGAAGEGRTAPADGQPGRDRTAQPATNAVAAAAAAASAGTASQRADLEAADRAGQDDAPQPKKRPQPVRSGPTIGRNEVVTIQDPKTGDTETLKYKKAQPKLQDGWRLVATPR